MVDASTPPRYPDAGSVPSARRLQGWVGAWLAVVVLTGWFCGFGGRTLIAALLPAAPRGDSGRAIDPVLFLAWTGGTVATVLLATRWPRGRSGSRSAHLAPFLTWFALAVWAGARGASAGLACASDRSVPTDEKTDWIVRVDSIDWAQVPPSWSGRAFAWVAAGSWMVPRRPLPLRGIWSECETGGFLLRGRAIAPEVGRPFRMQVDRAYRLTGRAGAGRDGLRAAGARWRTALARDVLLACGPDAGALAVLTILGPATPQEPGWARPFRETGTVHLLSISGFHLTLIGGLLWTLLRVLTGGAPWARWPTLVVLGAYAAFVGGPTPVQRAFGVALLLAFGRGWGRASRFWNALGWTAALLPILEPGAPATASFRLSFTAMAGVIWGAGLTSRPILPRAVRPQRGSGPRRGAGACWKPAVQLLCSSFGAGLLTAPWSLHHFGIVYPLGVAANLLAIPAMAVTLAIQGVAVIATAFGASASFPLVAVGRVAGESFLAGLRELAGVSGRWAWTGSCGLVPALAWTVGLALALRVAASRRIRGRAAVGWVLIGAFPAVAASGSGRVRERTMSRAPLEVTVLDVGQGDAVLLRLGPRRWLVDLGLGSLTGRRDRLVPGLCARGVRRVERVWVTHGDGDHWGGLGDLLSSPVRVDTLVLPAGAPFPRAFWEALARGPQRPVVLRESAGWERVSSPGLRARVLHPPRPAGTASPRLPRGTNGWSLALLLESRSEESAWSPRVLLCGDLERDGEENLLREWGPGRPVTLALLAHHGSRTAGGEAWWGRVRPGLAVISVGRGNAYGLPHPETLGAAHRNRARLRRTDENGAIRCALGAKEVHVRAVRPPCS